MRHGQAAAAACNVLGLALILGVVLLSLPLALPRLLGYQAYAIVSGSMEPAIPTGSLVYAKPVEPRALAPGNVVVFYANATPVTHRVVENDTANGTLTTQGDANAAPDLAPVSYYNVIGRVAFHLPLLGLFLPAFSGTGGKLALLGLLLAGALFRALSVRLRTE